MCSSTFDAVAALQGVRSANVTGGAFAGCFVLLLLHASSLKAAFVNKHLRHSVSGSDKPHPAAAADFASAFRCKQLPAFRTGSYSLDAAYVEQSSMSATLAAAVSSLKHQRTAQDAAVVVRQPSVERSVAKGRPGAFPARLPLLRR